MAADLSPRRASKRRPLRVSAPEQPTVRRDASSSGPHPVKQRIAKAGGRAPVPAVVDLNGTLVRPPRQIVRQLRMDAGVCQEPTVERRRCMRPPPACKRRQRPTMRGSGLGEHLRLVVTSKHDVKCAGGKTSRAQVRLGGGSAIKQVADLHHPKAGSATVTRVKHAERA